MSQTLETMEPNPVWVEDAYSDTVDVLTHYADEFEYKIWAATGARTAGPSSPTSARP